MSMQREVIELSVSPEKVFYILVKAREFDEKTAASDENSGSNASDDGDIDILEDRSDDPTYQELIDSIDGLNEDEQLDLIALMWIGRGDYTAEEWEEARQQAADMRYRDLPNFLSQTPLLSDFLEEGLSKAGCSIEEYEIDRL